MLSIYGRSISRKTFILRTFLCFNWLEKLIDNHLTEVISVIQTFEYNFSTDGKVVFCQSAPWKNVFRLWHTIHGEARLITFLRCLNPYFEYFEIISCFHSPEITKPLWYVTHVFIVLFLCVFQLETENNQFLFSTLLLLNVTLFS